MQSGPCAIGSCAIGSVRNRVRAQLSPCAIESVRNWVRAQLGPCPIETMCVRLKRCVSDRYCVQLNPCPIGIVSDRVRVRSGPCAIRSVSDWNRVRLGNALVSDSLCAQLGQSLADITRPSNRSGAKHDVRYHISTKGPPIAERTRSLPPDKLWAARVEFEFMLKEGICRPSNSQWASPLHVVRKKSGEWRPCRDYRRLNSVTIPDRYPLPHIQDVAHQFHELKIFSTLDLSCAYYHIPGRSTENSCNYSIWTI